MNNHRLRDSINSYEQREADNTMWKLFKLTLVATAVRRTDQNFE
jgi:hypothetical protein